MAKTITYEIVQDLSTEVSLKFQKGLDGYKPVYKEIAPAIKSSGVGNTYPFSNLPAMREWVGDRAVQGITEKQYSLINRKFENTLTIPRTAIEDDNTGFYTAQAESMGREATQYPDKLLTEAILLNGNAYDDAPFFGNHANGTNPFNNLSLEDGGQPWILVDMSKTMSAFFYQNRTDFKIEKPKDLSDYTFMKDMYLFGIRGRGAIGYGLPQLAHGSTKALNEANFEEAMQKMLEIKKENGTYIGVMPTHIIVGPSNYSAALKLFNNPLNSVGGTNTYYNQVKIVVLTDLVIDYGTATKAHKNWLSTKPVARVSKKKKKTNDNPPETNAEQPEEEAK